MRLACAGVSIAIETALAGATATVGSGQVAVHKQRIAIDEVFPAGGGVGTDTVTGTFVVWPLDDTPGDPHSPGRLVETDKGTVTALVRDGGITPTLRNGMAVWQSVAREELIGRRGTLRLSVRFDVRNIPVDGARVLLGIWKITGGTRAHSGLRGGGRYVSVVMPTGRRVVRQEGWVTR